jgi:hypothetical protein
MLNCFTERLKNQKHPERSDELALIDVNTSQSAVEGCALTSTHPSTTCGISTFASAKTPSRTSFRMLIPFLRRFLSPGKLLSIETIMSVQHAAAVIPVKAVIQYCARVWMPADAGVTPKLWS